MLNRPGRGRAAAAAALLLAGAAVIALRALAPSPAGADGPRVEVPVPPDPLAARRGGAAQALVPAPDPGLVGSSPDGPLPVIGPDGREAWQVYARPFDRSDRRPRIAILLAGLGVSDQDTAAAIDRLPGAVTLAFDPYPQGLRRWIERARRTGHEVLLELPMEPLDYPRHDPGPLTLLTALEPQRNLARLNQVMSRATGYVGLMPLMGSRFLASPSSLLPVLNAIRSRGLMFVAARGSPDSVVTSLARSVGLPWAPGDRVIDAEPDPAALDRQLADLEAVARRDGAALGIGSPYPVTIDRVAAWAATLDGKGIALAPTSAIATRQSGPAEAKR